MALERQLTFDEDKILRLVTPYITASMNLAGGTDVVSQDVARTSLTAATAAEAESWKGAGNIIEGAEPGNPGIQFWTRDA